MFRNTSTHEVERVTMRSWFYLDNNKKPSLYEYTLSKYEWKEYLRAHKLSKWIPFTWPSFWMSPDLEDLVCGLKPERYVFIRWIKP